MAELSRSMKGNVKAARRQGRANLRQKEALVDYLTANPHVASGKFSSLNAKAKLYGSWEELAAMLSSLKSKESDKDKDVASWKTTWRHMKSEVSSRFSQLRKARAATGNIEVETPRLSEMDQKILGIIGLNYVEGSSVCVDAFPEEHGISVMAMLEAGDEAAIQAAPIPLTLRPVDRDEFVLDLHEDEILSYSGMDTTETYTPQTSGQCRSIPTTIADSVEANTAQRADTSLHVDNTTPSISRKERVTNKARLAVQMDCARERFAAIAERQTATLEKLTETIRQQGEAIKLLARGEEERNKIIMKMVDNDRENKLLINKLMETFININKNNQ